MSSDGDGWRHCGGGRKAHAYLLRVLLDLGPSRGDAPKHRELFTSGDR